jgi:CheY-like chemotaxis protein
LATNELSSEIARSGDRAYHILVVEDEALVASYIQDVLEESGFRVIGTASSGPEALAVASGTAIDLALVDIKLAGPMDGIEVARVIRERFNIPSLFLSGMADPATMERAKLVEHLGFLQKPFRPSQVFNALEQAVGKLFN